MFKVTGLRAASRPDSKSYFEIAIKHLCSLDCADVMALCCVIATQIVLANTQKSLSYDMNTFQLQIR